MFLWNALICKVKLVHCVIAMVNTEKLGKILLFIRNICIPLILICLSNQSAANDIAAVETAHPLATSAGYAILKKEPRPLYIDMFPIVITVY